MSSVVRNILGLFLFGTGFGILGVGYLKTNQRLEYLAAQTQIDLRDLSIPSQIDIDPNPEMDQAKPDSTAGSSVDPGQGKPISNQSDPTSITYTYPTYTTEEITQSNNTYVTSNVDLGSLGKSRLLYVTTSSSFGSLGEGESGQYLRSNGTGELPTWVSLSGTGLGGSIVGDDLAIGGGTPFAVDSDGRLELSYVGDSGYLSSSGGAIFIDNTSNDGTALGIYSDAGASAMGNMINVKVNNPAYAQAAFYMNYDGSSNAVEIVSNSQDSSSNALAVTGNNINDSTLGIIGYELGKGTIKVSHYRPGTGNDSSASGLSIDLKGVGTRAQGVYVDSTETGGTLGNLLRLRNESIDRFVVNYQGNLTTAGSITQGAYGTDTTYTKYGNTTGDQFFVGTNGSFRVQRAASNSEAFRTQISGDTQGRWVGTSDGRLRWGDGSNATDVTLRRGATGILWLDGGIVLNNLNESYDTVIKGATDSVLFVADSATDAIGIGISAPLAPLHIHKNGGGNAGMIINQLGNADILAASASGVTRLRLTQEGNIVLAPAAGLQPATDAVNGLSIKNASGTEITTFDTSNGRVGIGTTAPAGTLHVFGGDIILENNQAIRIKNSGGSASPTLSYSSGNNLQLYNYATGGIVQIGINNVSNTAGNIRFFTNNNVERMRIDPAGVGIGATSFGSSAANVLAIASSTAPTTNITDGIQLFAVDQAGSHELRVRDEAGNVTTLSPHNFSLIPDGRSEDVAWAFYSERGNLAVNADMTRALRLIEELSGEQLLYVKDMTNNQYLSMPPKQLRLAAEPVIALQPPTIEENGEINPALAEVLSRYLETSQLQTHLTWDKQLLKVLSEITFMARATFEKSVQFLATVTFGDRVTFEGPAEFEGPVVFENTLTVDQDTAGTIILPAGSTQATVTFEQAFPKPPLVYLSPNSPIDGGYSLGDVTANGFTVRLRQGQSQEVQIQWLAVVKNEGSGAQVQIEGSQTSSNEQVDEASNASAPELTPDSIQLPSATPNPTPLATPAAENSGQVAGDSTATASAETE